MEIGVTLKDLRERSIMGHITSNFPLWSLLKPVGAGMTTHYYNSIKNEPDTATLLSLKETHRTSETFIWKMCFQSEQTALKS